MNRDNFSTLELVEIADALEVQLLLKNTSDGKEYIIDYPEEQKGKPKRGRKSEEQEVCSMTAIRKEAIELLERVPEDKLSFVIQIMRGVNGLLGDAETTTKKVINLDQFVMPATERGQNADSYIRELRDNDRI